MFEVVVLTVVLSRQPVKCSSTREESESLCFDSGCPSDSILDQTIEYNSRFKTTNIAGSPNIKAAIVKEFSTTPEVHHASIDIADRFHHLAAQWSEETSHVSSVTRAIAQPSYQAIIELGWDAVPLMLRDLKKNKGFWYPALNAITGIRPFDPKDAGNSRKMTEAWISWGHKKGLI